MSTTAALDRHDLRRVVAVLCTTEIISWGVLFYAFPVLATAIADTEGHSLPTLVAIFTGAQVIAAVAGIWVGRHIDRHGPRHVMTTGSVIGLAGILILALAPGLVGFTVAWAIIGLAMSATLYPPAFAAITHWAGARRVRALTAVTLVAGLASTVFAPLAAVLEHATDWRTTYLVLLIPLAVCAPLHLWGLSAPWAQDQAQTPSDGPGEPMSRSGLLADPVVREPAFLLVVVALTLAGFSIYAVVVNLVPLLTENGISTTTAAIALGIGGAGQVAGRLIYGPILAPLAVRYRTSVTLAVAGATTGILALVPGPVALVLVISFAAGTARGIFTLIQATAVSDRWGTTSYGARSGILSGVVTVASALSPWAGAALAATIGGYDAAFAVLAALALIAAALSLSERPHSRATTTPATTN